MLDTADRRPSIASGVPNTGRAAIEPPRRRMSVEMTAVVIDRAESRAIRVTPALLSAPAPGFDTSTEEKNRTARRKARETG